jgi:hypothetical protein
MFFTQLAYYDHIACRVYSCYNLMGEGNILQVEDMPTLLKLQCLNFLILYSYSAFSIKLLTDIELDIAVLS